MSTDPDFVCVIGTDGSGKTTQCERLCSRLRERGHDVTYSWCKFESKLLFYIVQAVKTLLSRTGEDMDDYSKRKEKKDSILSHSIVRVPFLFYILVHYYGQVLWKISWPLLRGQTVVCDRYVYDTMVDIAVDFDYEPESVQWLLDLYLRFVPTPDVLIYLEVPPSVSLERKDDIPNRAFVAEKKAVYDAILMHTGAETISGADDIETVSSKINEYVFSDSHSIRGMD